VTPTETRRPTTDTGALPRLLPQPFDRSLDAHPSGAGPLPHRGPELIAMVTAAGLRGRGGAAFPTGTKMAAVARGPGPKVVVANGTEGEPLSHKDRTLLTLNPHSVLDGIAAAADALGARRAVLCVKQGQPDLVALLRRAIAGRGDVVPVEVRETPDRYVAGQETALVRWLNGGEARPMVGPRPFIQGVDGRPTLLDNVETLAHIGMIARYGADWFRQLGTQEEPGSALVTVSGAVGRPGVYEIPLGLPLAQLLDDVEAQPPAALLVGGYFGRWVDPRRRNQIELSDNGLADLGARLGCGVVVSIPDDSCTLAEIAAVAEWYASHSAGQLAGERHAEVAARRWTDMVRGRGACQFPDGAAMFIESALDVLGEEIQAHRHGGCGLPYRHHLPAPPPGAWR
jgi:NADH:ubiquinone oxidoreductase subunit F (NADH-binding)